MKLLLNSLSYLLFSLCALFCLTSAQAQTQLGQEKTVSPYPFRYESIALIPSTSATGALNTASMFIAEQLERNLSPEMRSRALVVTDFVALNTLNETSQLGRLLAQNLMHEMQLRNWSITDITFRKNILIESSGEFSLSRDVKQLKPPVQTGSIITGTYVNTAEGLILNVRMIQVISGAVVSTAQVKLPADRLISHLLDGPPRPPTMPVLNLTN
jgi:TolB-like protein